MGNERKTLNNPYHPWDWYIYLHFSLFLMVKYGFHVGKFIPVPCMRHGFKTCPWVTFQRTSHLVLERNQVKGVRSSNVWESMSKMCVSLGEKWGNLGVNPKMVGFPNKPMGFFLLKMISTWGVKWGYHHENLRKHPLGGGLEIWMLNQK